MVKLAENEVVDLDIMPGHPQCDQVAQQARDAVGGEIPGDDVEGCAANADAAVYALGGTVGGGLRGVVDTAGNTVGSLVLGLQGTVQVVGDGLGSTVQFAGRSVGASLGKLGGMMLGGEGGTAAGEGVIEGAADAVKELASRIEGGSEGTTLESKQKIPA